MPGQVSRYLSRISGPLMDRIDLQVEIMPVPFEELSSMEAGERSSAIRERVVKARALQTLRFNSERNVHCNAQMNSRLLADYAALDDECMERLRYAMKRFDMSARAYDRILKVARTIADLDYANRPGMTMEKAVAAPILPSHLQEAISYRNLDRSTWGSALSPS